MDTKDTPGPEPTKPEGTEQRSAPVRLAARNPTTRLTPVDTGRHRHSLYRELLLGLYDAVIVSDLEGNIVDANGRAEEFLLYTADDLRSTRAQSLISGLSDQILGKIREHLAAGRFTVLDAHCIRKDGTRFPAEIAIGRVRVSGTGNLVFSVRNIEWRKQAEEKLRTEHNALQNSASAIAITDMQGRLTYVNPAFLTLWRHDDEREILGQEILSLWPSDSVPFDLLTAPLESETWIGEITAVDATGKQRCLHATAAQNRNTHDEPTGMVFSFIDITEQKEAEAAIRREAEAQMSQASSQQNFAGSLNILSISDVFQLIKTTNKSGTLVICDSNETEVAQIAFASGQVARASYSGVTGDAAVFGALCGEAAAFRFRQGEPVTRDPDITKTVMNYLLESAQQQDEGRS